MRPPTPPSTSRGPFCTYGDILESKIIHDRETGRSKGFGFVTFREEQARRDAIEGMNGQMLDGRSVTVNEAQARGGGGFSSGGGGGGHSGGRRDGGGYSRGGGGRSRFPRGGGASEGNWRN